MAKPPTAEWRFVVLSVPPEDLPPGETGVFWQLRDQGNNVLAASIALRNDASAHALIQAIKTQAAAFEVVVAPENAYVE